MAELIEEIKETVREAERFWRNGVGISDFEKNYRKMLNLLKKIENSIVLYEV